jgi:hypothetical protein
MTLSHLLTLRVTLRDEAACAAIPPEQANAYLAAKGWEMVRGMKYAHTWRLASRYVTVPNDVTFADYGRRLCEVANTVAEVENRSALAVYADLASAAGSD